MTECELLQKISSDVWEKLARHHYEDNRQNEIGISGDLVNAIREYIEDEQHFKIYCQKAKNEPERGADIEIYKEAKTGGFYRFMIQAKIIETDRKLKNLKKMSGDTGRRQYDTLIDYGESVNSPTAYLVFNGIPDFHKVFNDCAGKHDEKQFGCSLISSQTIKEYVDKENTSVLNINEGSRPMGDPWRLISCCDMSQYVKSDHRTYRIDEIDMDEKFSKLFTLDMLGFRMAGSESQSITQRENEKIHKKGWNPKARIILTNRRLTRGTDTILKYD